MLKKLAVMYIGPSELLIKLAKNGEKLGNAPAVEDRKEKLNFAMSSVANNF